MNNLSASVNDDSLREQSDHMFLTGSVFLRFGFHGNEAFMEAVHHKAARGETTGRKYDEVKWKLEDPPFPVLSDKT